MRNFIWMTILAAGQLLLCVPGAMADANLCNSASNPIWASYGEYYANENYWTGETNPSAWIVGWYYVQPGQCATPIAGDVCFWWAYVWNNCPNAVLYYAEDAAGDWWGGANGDSTLPLSICTTQNAFDENAQMDGVCSPDRSWLLWSEWFYSQPADDVTVTFTN